VATGQQRCFDGGDLGGDLGRQLQLSERHGRVVLNDAQDGGASYLATEHLSRPSADCGRPYPPPCPQAGHIGPQPIDIRS
jgi:hypothetical protein